MRKLDPIVSMASMEPIQDNDAQADALIARSVAKARKQRTMKANKEEYAPFPDDNFSAPKTEPKKKKRKIQPVVVDEFTA